MPTTTGSGLISRITAIGSYPGSSTTATTTQTFGYDNAGRLSSFNGDINNGNTQPNINQTQYFGYEANGNRTVSILQGINSTFAYAAGSNRLTSVTGTVNRNNLYDASGNLTSDGTNTYSYDARGRMTNAVAGGVNTSYLINYQNLRVKKTNAAETRHFVYDDAGHMLGEYNASGTVVNELVWLGDTPVAVRGTMPCLTGGACTETATAYVWSDHLNTPRELTRVNGSNQHVSLWKWDSLPFGETAPNANPSNLGVMTFNHRFPGQYKDSETGLHQNWYREYDATIGRYVTSDPIGLRGGTNTFNYVFGSPINGHDKLGLCTIVVVNLNGLGHAGVYVDNGPDGQSMLYDPAGSFGGVNAGSGNALYGKDANIDEYIKFQERDNPRDANGNVTSNNVRVFRIDTTPAEEAKIAKNAENRGGQNGGFCAIATSGAIKGIGPFKDIGRSLTPSGLASDLSKLAQGCK